MEPDEARIRAIVHEELAAYFGDRAKAEEGLLTAAELAVLLRCSRHQVYAMARSGDIAVLRIGRHLRFRLADVRASLEPKPVDLWARRSRKKVPRMPAR